MQYKIAFAKKFNKHYKDLSQNEKKQVMRKIEILSDNPMHPSLRTKKIQGADALFECSVNMDIRIIWLHEGDYLILLLDIGHHDILKSF